MNETFGERLEFTMLNKNITQEELAIITGVQKNVVSYWWNNKRIPNAGMIKKICEALNISADYLLGLSDSPTNDTAGKLVIEPKYRNVINSFIYDERIKKVGLIDNLVIKVLPAEYMMYFTARYDLRYSSEKVFPEDFVKRTVKFGISSDMSIEEREDEISRIKEFLGKDFSEDVIKEID